MIVLQTMAVAFAMFSALPVPQFTWNSKNMRYALCAFPLIGGGHRGAVEPLRGAAAARYDPGRRLLPHSGAGHRRHPSGRLCRHFGRPFQLWRPGKEAGNFKRPPLRGLCRHPALHLLPRVFLRCVLHPLLPRVGLCWTLALVLERGLSGLAVAAFPMAKNTGLAHTFATAADRESVQKILIVLSVLLAAALIALGGGALVAAALLVLWRYHHVAVKEFGGITGDLAGWFLQKAEFWMLAALAASQWGRHFIT